MALNKGLTERGIKIRHRIPLRADWRDHKHKSQLLHADIVIVNGEGSTHSSRDWVKDLLAVVDFVHAHGIPCCLINCVYQNNNQEIDDLVRRFDLVSARESKSQRELSLSSIPAICVPDLSFYSFPTIKRSRPSTPPIYLFSDSVLPEITAQLSTRFHHRDGFSQILIWKPDLSLWRHLRHKLSCKLLPKRRRTIYSFGNPLDAHRLMGRSELLVTGRFHFTCFAIAAGCPFLSTPSNTHKIEGMLQDAGLSHRILHTNQILAYPKDVPAWTEADSEACARFSRNAKESIGRLFDSIKDIGLKFKSSRRT